MWGILPCQLVIVVIAHIHKWKWLKSLIKLLYRFCCTNHCTNIFISSDSSEVSYLAKLVLSLDDSTYYVWDLSIHIALHSAYPGSKKIMTPIAQLSCESFYSSLH